MGRLINIKRGLYVAILLLLTCRVNAQDVKVQANIDKNNIVIGDAINLELKVTYNPLKNIVAFPQLPDTFNGFEIVERQPMDTIFERELNIYKQDIVITHFDSGRWIVPSFKFEVQSKLGQAGYSLFTDSAWVNVNTIAVDTAKPFKPIMAIRGATKPIKDIILEIAGIVLGLALLIFLIWYVRKLLKEKNQKPEAKMVQPLLPPHERALQELEKITAEALYEKGDEKMYHTQITDVIKTYLENQFGLDCFEKTTSELMQGIKKQKALANCRQQIRTILETADMVKFAKSKPTVEAHILSAHLAREAVLESFKKYQNQTTEPKA